VAGRKSEQQVDIVASLVFNLHGACRSASRKSPRRQDRAEKQRAPARPDGTICIVPDKPILAQEQQAARLSMHGNGR
jgi:hypothetical protein